VNNFVLERIKQVAVAETIDVVVDTDVELDVDTKINFPLRLVFYTD
jgi:hypothetical protein